MFWGYCYIRASDLVRGRFLFCSFGIGISIPMVMLPIIEMCGKHRLPKFFSAGVNPLFSKQGVHDCRKQKVNAVYVWAVGAKTVPLIKDRVVFDDYAREAGERF